MLFGKIPTRWAGGFGVIAQKRKEVGSPPKACGDLRFASTSISPQEGKASGTEVPSGQKDEN